jgi:hypothetical protein
MVKFVLPATLAFKHAPLIVVLLVKHVPQGNARVRRQEYVLPALFAVRIRAVILLGVAALVLVLSDRVVI